MEQKKIRLSDSQVTAICAAFKSCFNDGDSLWVFGSRADITKRGGDIDLYVETTLQPLKQAIDIKNKFFTKLVRELGDQKIDIVINNDSGTKLIYNIAKTEGVQLV